MTGMFLWAKRTMLGYLLFLSITCGSTALAADPLPDVIIAVGGGQHLTPKGVIVQDDVLSAVLTNPTSDTWPSLDIHLHGEGICDRGPATWDATISGSLGQKSVEIKVTLDRQSFGKSVCVIERLEGKITAGRSSRERRTQERKAAEARASKVELDRRLLEQRRACEALQVQTANKTLTTLTVQELDRIAICKQRGQWRAE